MKILLVSTTIVTALLCQPALAELPSFSLPSLPSAPPAQCVDCGAVQGVNKVEKEGESSGIVGAVAGGALGGLLGNQIGGGNGRKLATVAGVVGGAVAGNQAEKYIAKKTIYEVVCKFDDGRTQVFSYDNPPVWQVGSRVKLVNGVLQVVP